jgi:hypothetical protein
MIFKCANLKCADYGCETLICIKQLVIFKVYHKIVF